MGNEYQPKRSNAVQLGSKGRRGSFNLWMSVWVASWQVKVCDPLLIRAISERFRDEFLLIKCYTNLLYFTFYLYQQASCTQTKLWLLLMQPYTYFTQICFFWLLGLESLYSVSTSVFYCKLFFSFSAIKITLSAYSICQVVVFTL